jgi:hypothetical protein
MTTAIPLSAFPPVQGSLPMPPQFLTRPNSSPAPHFSQRGEMSRWAMLFPEQNSSWDDVVHLGVVYHT